MFKALTPFLSIVTALVVLFFFVKPMYEEIQSIQAETTQYREAVAKASELNKKLEDLLQKKNSFSASELERVDAIAPNAINVTKILVDLEALAQRHRVLIGNFDGGESASDNTTGDAVSGDAGFSFENDFDSKDISFSIIGTYEQFRSFLADLERSLTIMEVTDLSFSVLEGDLQQYEFTVRTYALREARIQ